MMTFTVLILIFIIVCLLIISATFSALETAITASSKAKIHQYSKNGSKKAAIIKSLQQKVGMVISGLLVGNTLLNALIVSLTTGLINDYMGKQGFVGEILSSIIMGTIIVIYAEVTPKLIAVKQAESILLRVAYPLNGYYKIILPVTHLINSVARFTLKLFRVSVPNNDELYLSVEELKGAIDMHHGPGQDVPHERAMLKSVLDLGSVKVAEIMTHRKNIAMINGDEPLERIIEQALSSPYTRIPIWQDNPDNIIGVLHMKTLLRALQSSMVDPKDINLAEICQKPWFIPENTDLLDQLHAFKQRREHFAIVVDEYGALLGIVTLEDILEEIVGEISDEHDISVKGIKPQADGSYLINGNVTIRDINRELDFSIPDDRASTIAGFVLYESRMIPEVGQTFVYHNFKIKILKKQRNQLTLVQLYPQLLLGSM